MADEPAPTSIAARIAALNLQQVGQQPTSAPPSYEQATAKKRPPPPLPRRPQSEARSQSVNNPPLQSATHASPRTIGNQPAADANSGKELAAPPTTRFTGRDTGSRPEPPQRPPLPQRASQESTGAPSLPPRKASTPGLTRRDSQDSIASTLSTKSSFSVRSNGTSQSARTSLSDANPARSVKAPAYDPNTLPPLPERRVKEEPETREPAPSARTFPTTLARVKAVLPGRQSTGTAQPPVLPSRPSLPPRPNSVAEPPLARNLPPRRSALSYGLNKSTEAPPPISMARPGSAAPPPVPHSSRPDLAALQASKPKPGAVPDASLCLHCRDFSTVDAHAARFLRQNLPSLDIGWLANQLCSPFPSATDKARAIFTFLHHNIEYDVDAFFNNCIKPSTPNSTLASGLAVCEGYAGLFVSLALAAGLEAVVVGGDGKGFGYKQLAPGEPIPPFSSNHAWSACKIDNGEWKLLDPCWGAGNVKGAGQPYQKSFNPRMFTQDNAEFGLHHYPEDPSKWFGPAMTWEEYQFCEGREEKVQTYGDSIKHGVKESSFLPKEKAVRRDPNLGPAVRFSFNKPCKHWTTEKAGYGAPYLLVLAYGGAGANEKLVPLNHDGFFWWLDVDRHDLGPRGSTVRVISMDSFDGRDGKGLTAVQFNAKIGKCGWSCGILAEWRVD